MTMRKRALETMGIVAILFGVVSLGSANAALAQSVAAPKNLRVTGVTDWTVALMWDAPKGKAPSSYVVQCTSNGRSMMVAGSPGIIFNALTAVALAGVSLAGGRGSLPRVLVGALVLGTISNGLTLKGIQPFWATTVTGVLLLASLGLEKWVSTTVSRRVRRSGMPTTTAMPIAATAHATIRRRRDPDDRA